MAKEKKAGNIDVWLVMVIILMVLSIGGGLWLTGQSVLARLDMVSTQTRSQLGRLETETFELRKQLQSLEAQVRQLGTAVAAPSKAAPPSGSGEQ